ncbi:heat shock cognate 70 kDa protein 2-like [Lolium rigidum]|uniref:heat shock cognate 70 kDa protein 2-like n=1 Tax=Lolium rigidum TaxID=89674 RepID=UPI001F5C5273|nr:heat shock cognate 70 kDa protein 2-like [Lolium rigidum]
MTETDGQQGSAAIGIDLGTAWSCVGVYRHGRVEIITNEHGGRTTPSYVAFTDTERLVGDAAKNQAARNSTNTIFGTKRLIGRRFSDASVQADMKLWPFKVMAGRGDKPMVAANYKRKQKLLAPEEIASMLLAKMKGDAKAYLGAPVTNAVVTVPVSFDILQRRATKDALAIAGLNVIGVIHEPVAAAVAYGLHESTETKNVLVFDVGGGTTSVALLAIAAGKITVRSTAGDPHLGGEDFDRRMVEHLLEQFKTEYKKDVSGSTRALVRLRAACEHAKRTLSSATWAPIEIDCLLDGIDFRTAVTRDQFEDLNMDLFCKCMEPVKKCLGDAKVERSDVHEVVLVGGSTRIPSLRRMLQDLFDGRELRKDINLEEAVARGAAILADIASRVPGSDLLNLFLLDTTPRSLGVEAAGGAMAVIVPRNSAIPIRREQIISIQSHHKRSVVLSVFEGENGTARDNRLLGELKLSAGDGAKRQISVRFDIDADGVLTVYATDKAAKRMHQMKFMDKGQLSKNEIKRMTEEAAEYMAEDAGNRERVKAKNLLEEYLYKKRRAIEVERRKAEDALSAVELMIQQVHSDQVSSARKFLDDLERLKLESSTIAGKQVGA